MPKKIMHYGDFSLTNVVSENRIKLNDEVLEHLGAEQGDQLILWYEDGGKIEMKKFDKRSVTK